MLGGGPAPALLVVGACAGAVVPGATPDGGAGVGAAVGFGLGLGFVVGAWAAGRPRGDGLRAGWLR